MKQRRDRGRGRRRNGEGSVVVRAWQRRGAGEVQTRRCGGVEHRGRLRCDGRSAANTMLLDNWGRRRRRRRRGRGRGRGQRGTDGRGRGGRRGPRERVTWGVASTAKQRRASVDAALDSLLAASLDVLDGARHARHVRTITHTAAPPRTLPIPPQRLLHPKTHPPTPQPAREDRSPNQRKDRARREERLLRLQGPQSPACRGLGGG